MVSSSWGCLLSVVCHSMAAAPNRKTDALPPSGDLAFSGFIYGEGNVAIDSVGLVHLVEIHIALRFWG